MAKITSMAMTLIMTVLAGCAAAVPGYVQKIPPPAVISNSAIKTPGQSEVVRTDENYALYYNPLLISYYPASVGIDAGASFGPGTERYNPISYYGGY